MSLRLKIRFSIICLVSVAMLTYVFAETSYGQKRRLTRPPGAGDAGGPPDAGDALGDQDASRTRPRGRPSSVGDRRGGGNTRGGATTTSARPKFVNLLDSKDLSQFRGYAQEEIGEGWSYDSKSLYFDGSGGGDVITKEVYDNFDLQVEWKVADGANSGIMYRVSLGDDAPYMSGPEYQILDDGEHEDGKNELTAAGSLYGMYPAKEKSLKEVGTWNKTRIIVDGNKVTHYLNSKKVLEIEIGSDDWNKHLADSKFKDWEKFAKNSEGHIAFQDHGNEVWFRNIRIKRLVSADVAKKKSDNKKAASKANQSKIQQMQNSVSGADSNQLDVPDK